MQVALAYEIAGRQIVVLSILVLYLGYFIKRRVGFLGKYSIPVSVTGGLIFSVAAALLAGFSIIPYQRQRPRLRGNAR